MEPQLDRNGDPFCRHGGLTLVPMPGFESRAEELAGLILEKSNRDGEYRTPVDVAIPTFKFRPSGEPYLVFGKRHLDAHDVFVLASGPGTYEMTGQMDYLLAYLAGHKASRITIVFGYFPQGRSDRDEHNVFAIPPILVTKWLVLSQGLLRRIVCLDPHSDQSTMVGHTGLITPVWLTYRLLKHVYQEAQAVSDKVVLAFPDPSARKRFKAALKQLRKDLGQNLQIVYASADRVDAERKTIDGIGGDLDAVDGALVIQLDDETASGVTQMKAAEQLHNVGAREIWSAVTHGVLCANAPTLFAAPNSLIARLYIMDTIPPELRLELRPLLESGRLRVLSWRDDAAWVIYNVHWGFDVRETRGIENT
ncbi:ribose-phosphate pyrophosphokinase [Candidatus Uhrbacteria bacterium]|nr:ribose-phosphate pyrophosphokinase [Candidatus Uhrbacteria bacterium]